MIRKNSHLCLALKHIILYFISGRMCEDVLVMIDITSKHQHYVLWFQVVTYVKMASLQVKAVVDKLICSSEPCRIIEGCAYN